MSTESNARTHAFEATEQANKQAREFGEQANKQAREFGEQANQQARELTEQATQQTRELTEQVVGTSRAYGHMALDTYEQAVNSFVEFEQRAADAAPVDWVKTAIGAHAAFVKDVADAYVKAARNVID
jgi:F0F1-type ATP synthase membrane subunit b/b'